MASCILVALFCTYFQGYNNLKKNQYVRSMYIIHVGMDYSMEGESHLRFRSICSNWWEVPLFLIRLIERDNPL